MKNLEVRKNIIAIEKIKSKTVLKKELSNVLKLCGRRSAKIVVTNLNECDERFTCTIVIEVWNEENYIDSVVVQEYEGNKEYREELYDQYSEQANVKVATTVKKIYMWLCENYSNVTLKQGKYC